MLKYLNTTTKEQFKSYYLDWAGEKINSVPSQLPTQRSWEITDNFGNAWTVSFTGEVGEFTVEGKCQPGCHSKFGCTCPVIVWRSSKLSTADGISGLTVFSGNTRSLPVW